MPVDNDWQYDPEIRAAIIEALIVGGPPVEPGHRTSLLKQVAVAAGAFRTRTEYEIKKPSPGVVRREAARLDKALAEIRNSFGGLSQQARLKLDRFAVKARGGAVSSVINGAIEALTQAASVVSEFASTPAKKGKPSKRSRRQFVRDLAIIWTDARGAWPTRRTKNGKETGPFLDFVRVCLRPFGHDQQGVEDIVREVCEQGKNDL